MFQHESEYQNIEINKHLLMTVIVRASRKVN